MVAALYSILAMQNLSFRKGNWGVISLSPIDKDLATLSYKNKNEIKSKQIGQEDKRHKIEK